MKQSSPTPTSSLPKSLKPNNIIAGSGSSGSGEAEQTISYSAERIIGNGSFGVVFQATVVETGDVVAIKKVSDLGVGGRVGGRQ